jgi:hypothetical protein
LLFDYFEIEENEFFLKDLIKKELKDLDEIDNSPDAETKIILDQLYQNIQKNKIK